MAAQNNGRGTSLYIKEYGITDQKALAKIAESAAQNNGEETSMLIKKYGINDLEAKLEILLIAMMQNPKSVNHFSKFEFPNSFLPDLQQTMILFKEIADNKAFVQNSKFLVDRVNIWAEKQIITLRHIAEKLHTIQNEKIAEDLSFWFIYILARSELSKNKYCISWLNKHQSELNTIFGYRNPKKRMEIIKALFDVFESNPTAFDIYEKIKPSPSSRIPILLLTVLHAQGRLSEKHYLEFGKLIASNSGFKNVTILNALVNALTALVQDAEKTQDDIHHIFELILPKIKETPRFEKQRIPREELLVFQKLSNEEKKLERKKRKNARNQKLRKEKTEVNKIKKYNNKETKDKVLLQRALVGIYDFSKGDQLTKDNLVLEKNDLENLFQKAFQERVPCKDVKNFAEKYFMTFGASRKPQAINTYAAKVSSLNDQKMNEVLGAFVEDVLENRFTANRYRKENSKHLKQLVENHLETFKKWQLNIKVPLGEAVPNKKTKETMPNFEEILRTKLIDDKHLGKLSQTCSYLSDYFTQPQKKDLIKKNLLEDRKSAKKEDYDQLQFQLLCMTLMDNKSDDIAEILNLLKKIKTRLDKLEDKDVFKGDIDGLIESLQDRLKAKKSDRLNTWTVVDTDDPEDLFLCGTDVLGSCQNVNGKPSLNKCLPGYVSDGKNRLLAVKDKQGTIRARAILRILLDEDKPALFLERCYPDAADAQMQAALLELAKRKAKELGVKLYTTQFKTTTTSKIISLKSLGSPAPFEYVDAAGGKTPRGVYTISGAQLIG